MRKTYPLDIEGKHRDRVLDAIRHDIRKDLKRQRRVDLPDGVDYWDFAYKCGHSAEDAVPVHVGELLARIDALASEGSAAVYVEILPRHGHRKPGVASGVPADGA